MNKKNLAFALLGLNLIIAIAIAVLDPSKWFVVPLGAGLLPIMYIGARITCRNKGCTDLSEVHDHLAMGALMLTSALGVTLTNLLHLGGDDLGDRYIGAMMAMLIVFFGNRLPKQASNTCNSDSDPTGSKQRSMRQAGYIMVISGLLMMGSWIILPSSIAEIAFIAVGVLMLLVILIKGIENGRKNATA